MVAEKETKTKAPVEVRCYRCEKKLGENSITSGTFVTKCYRCKALNVVEAPKEFKKA